MTNKIYLLYYKLGQCYASFLSLFLVENSVDVIKNTFKLLSHKGNIKVQLKTGERFYIRSFNDLMILRQVFGLEIYKPLFTKSKQQATLIDLGAYIGDSAVYAKRFKNVKKIIAVEPVEGNVRGLKQNLKANNVTWVEVLQRAASSKSGKKRLSIFKDETRASLGLGSAPKSKTFVDTITLPQLIKKVGRSRILLKCDIEGGEYDVILNTPVSVLNRFEKMAIELHYEAKNGKEFSKKIVNRLENAGFTCNVKNSIVNPKYGMLYANKT